MKYSADSRSLVTPTLKNTRASNAFIFACLLPYFELYAECELCLAIVVDKFGLDTRGRHFSLATRPLYRHRLTEELRGTIARLALSRSAAPVL